MRAQTKWLSEIDVIHPTWNWDRWSGQCESDIYLLSAVPATEFKGRYFLPSTTGVNVVPSPLDPLESGVNKLQQRGYFSELVFCFMYF